MSSIKVPIVPIIGIRPHSNPEVERLEVATVEGWQLCVLKGQFQEGDLVVYFEQGTTIPLELAEQLNITTYLSNKTDINGDKVLVIHRIRLKGEASFGLAVTVPDEFRHLPIGTDLADYYGAQKYIPPVRARATDAEVDHPMFPAYTDVENLRSYPHILTEGELVVATEKVHGTNCRVGFVVEDDAMILMAGSRTLRRKVPDDYNTWGSNIYWHPWTHQGVTNLMAELRALGHQQVVLYGEVFGSTIQSYDYGVKGGRISFRAFDLMIDGAYVSGQEFDAYMALHEIPICPPVYLGKFNLDAIAEVSNGDSYVGGTHGREGVVVRPYNCERYDPQIGRVILKYVGDDYLFSKTAMKADTTDV